MEYRDEYELIMTVKIWSYIIFIKIIMGTEMFSLRKSSKLYYRMYKFSCCCC